MKPIALATVALLASTPAAAQTLKLPNEMLGTWCPTQDPLVEEKDGTSTIKYERRQDCSPADDTSIVLGPRGYGGQDVSCKAISGVTRSPPFLQVRYRCTGEGNITLNVRWRLIGLQLVWNSRVPRWEAAERFDKYECQVTEVVENLSTRKPKTLTPKDDLVLIEVAKNPPRMKVSHIDKKGKVAERNKQYQKGSYVLLSTDSTDTTDEMASPIFTLYGSRTVGSTIYRMVGKMTLDAEGDLFYGYYEEVYKGGSLDATIRARNCSERK